MNRAQLAIDVGVNDFSKVLTVQIGTSAQFASCVDVLLCLCGVYSGIDNHRDINDTTLHREEAEPRHYGYQCANYITFVEGDGLPFETGESTFNTSLIPLLFPAITNQNEHGYL